MDRSQSSPGPVPGVRWRDGALLVFDPAPLSRTQRAGHGCVVCGRRWPRPRVIVGIVPDGQKVRACGDCAELVATAAEARRPAEPVPAVGEAELLAEIDEAMALAREQGDGVQRGVDQLTQAIRAEQGQAEPLSALAASYTADVLRDARERVPHVAPDALAAITMAIGPHRGEATECMACALVRSVAGAVVEHLQRTEYVVGQDRLPPHIRDPHDARLWLLAWAAEGPPTEVITEVFDAVITDLVAGVKDL